MLLQLNRCDINIVYKAFKDIPVADALLHKLASDTYPELFYSVDSLVQSCILQTMGYLRKRPPVFSYEFAIFSKQCGLITLPQLINQFIKVYVSSLKHNYIVYLLL